MLNHESSRVTLGKSDKNEVAGNEQNETDCVLQTGQGCQVSAVLDTELDQNVGRRGKQTETQTAASESSCNVQNTKS